MQSPADVEKIMSCKTRMFLLTELIPPVQRNDSERKRSPTRIHYCRPIYIYIYKSGKCYGQMRELLCARGKDRLSRENHNCISNKIILYMSMLSLLTFPCQENILMERSEIMRRCMHTRYSFSVRLNQDERMNISYNPTPVEF